MNYNTRRFIIHRVKWLIAFMGIGSILVYLLPYPYDFISLASLFILMVYLRNRIEIKRFGGMDGIENLFGWLSLPKRGDQSRPLKYYCMSCEKEHNEITCPNCGSKMKRVG
jgi:hypothetical protein